MGRIYCEACGANWRSSGDGPEAQEHHVGVPCVGESTEFKQRAEIAALTERLRAVEAERDEVYKLLVKETPGGSEFFSDPVRCAKFIIDVRLPEARIAKIAELKRETAALRAELERKDAALKAQQAVVDAARALDGFNTGDCYEVEIEDYETLTAALENLRSDNDGK